MEELADSGKRAATLVRSGTITTIISVYLHTMDLFMDMDYGVWNVPYRLSYSIKLWTESLPPAELIGELLGSALESHSGRDSILNVME